MDKMARKRGKGRENGGSETSGAHEVDGKDSRTSFPLSPFPSLTERRRETSSEERAGMKESAL